MSGMLAGLGTLFAPAAGAATAGVGAATAAAGATAATAGATGGLLGTGGIGQILAGLSQGLMSWAEMSYQAKLEREKEERAIARNEGIHEAMDWYDSDNPVGGPKPAPASASASSAALPSATRSVGRDYKAKAQRAAASNTGRYAYNPDTRKIETK